MAKRNPQHVYDTLIVGTGFTGIGAAIKLTGAGVDDFIIVEREDRVGGTWRDNTYPGAACDIPSLLYSFSFVANPTWSRAYSPADEIRRHIEEMVDKFDIRRRIQFAVEVNGSTRTTASGTSPRSVGRSTAPAPSCWRPVRCPTTSCPTSAASTPTRARPSTVPGGTTTTTSAASGWP
jgi:cation diffusion facilitator CzcD-associated flavoprotein CzcO